MFDGDRAGEWPRAELLPSISADGIQVLTRLCSSPSMLVGCQFSRSPDLYELRVEAPGYASDCYSRMIALFETSLNILTLRS